MSEHAATAGYRIAAGLVCGLPLALGGCAGFGFGGGTDNMPQLDPGHSQIIAWVPRQQAQTATVAEAVAHIALTQAKKATEAELCKGTWLFSGKHQDTVPQLATAPANLGGFNGWHVQISWDPQLEECGISAQTYALTLSKYLPEWMMTQSGQPLALFHRGTALYHQDSTPLYALASQAAL